MATKSMLISLLFGVVVIGFGCSQAAETQNEVNPVITTFAPDAPNAVNAHVTDSRPSSEEEEYDDPRPFCRVKTQCRTILYNRNLGNVEDYQPCQCPRGTGCTYMVPFSIHDSPFPLEFYCKPRVDKDFIKKYVRSVKGEEIFVKNEETTKTATEKSTVTDGVNVVTP